MKQTTDTLMMVRPIRFRYNEETAENNYYQKELEGLTPAVSQERALTEFDEFVDKLRAVGVNVVVVQDTMDPDTPDSIFPNNWISFHESGRVALYPMNAVNRRAERREDVLDLLEAQGFTINEVIDYSAAESENVFLEGTGSMILDRANRKLYACLSQRTDCALVMEFSQDFDFEPIVFSANQTIDNERLPIYHTNVMMCVAETFAVICLDTIDDEDERYLVVQALTADGKEVISISESQKHRFAGNMLQVKGGNQFYLVMSSSAYESLNDQQITQIEKHCPILHASLDTIESCGGGSARCMMAEVFLPKEN